MEINFSPMNDIFHNLIVHDFCSNVRQKHNICAIYSYIHLISMEKNRSAQKNQLIAEIVVSIKMRRNERLGGKRGISCADGLLVVFQSFFP
jgi:hypothetical protein